jgi:predicted transposase YbfD/YdcC
MPSSPIAYLNDTLTGLDPVAADLTDRDRRGLLERLAEVPDPRDPRGVRYPLAGLLTIAVCAVMAGAVTFAAISDWLEDLPEQHLLQVGLSSTRPVATTIWRVLTKVDSVALSTALSAWLMSCNPLPGNHSGPGRRSAADTGPAGKARVVAVDGKTVRGTVTDDGHYVHLLSAYDVVSGITLAQIPLATKGGETGHFIPLMNQVETVLGSLTNLIIVADALHTQTAHAQHLNARGAALFVTVKANQPTLHHQMRTLPWKDIPVGNRTRDHAHGRRETRTLKAVTLTIGDGLLFPHAAQAVRITRTRIIDAKTTRETAYLIVTLPFENAGPRELNTWARQEWHIENRLHWVRDMTLREDEQRATTGTGPAVFAALRNTAIGFHRTLGHTNIARATRHAARHTSDLIHAVTSTGTTTQ